MASRRAFLIATAVWLCAVLPARAQLSQPEEARGWEEPPGTPVSDVVLFVPRVILAIPRYALEIVG